MINRWKVTQSLLAILQVYQTHHSPFLFGNSSNWPCFISTHQGCKVLHQYISYFMFVELADEFALYYRNKIMTSYIKKDLCAFLSLLPASLCKPPTQSNK